MDTFSRVGCHATGGFSWEVNVIDAEIIWDLDDEPDGNVHQIGERGGTVEEVEEVLRDPATRTGKSRRSGRPQAFGGTDPKGVDGHDPAEGQASWRRPPIR
jgi:hypothetical protein